LEARVLRGIPRHRPPHPDPFPAHGPRHRVQGGWASLFGSRCTPLAKTCPGGH
jgi:hypothetical protein